MSFLFFGIGQTGIQSAVLLFSKILEQHISSKITDNITHFFLIRKGKRIRANGILIDSEPLPKFPKLRFSFLQRIRIGNESVRSNYAVMSKIYKENKSKVIQNILISLGNLTTPPAHIIIFYSESGGTGSALGPNIGLDLMDAIRQKGSEQPILTLVPFIPFILETPVSSMNIVLSFATIIHSSSINIIPFKCSVEEMTSFFVAITAFDRTFPKQPCLVSTERSFLSEFQTASLTILLPSFLLKRGKGMKSLAGLDRNLNPKIVGCVFPIEQSNFQSAFGAIEPFSGNANLILRYGETSLKFNEQVGWTSDEEGALLFDSGVRKTFKLLLNEHLGVVKAAITRKAFIYKFLEIMRQEELEGRILTLESFMNKEETRINW